MRAACAHSRRQDGYTLVEVLVAFAVLALALTMLLRIMSGATHQVRSADAAGRATLYAQSLLDQVGIGGIPALGRTTGTLEDGRFDWILEVGEYHDPGLRAPAVNTGAPRLLQLSLTISWDEGGTTRSVALETLRLVRIEQETGGWGR